MDTIKINHPGKQMVAHRGASHLERENTLPAFIAAGNRSYVGIECDVHCTADGKFVICHDSNTQRVATDNLDVENSSFELLRCVMINDLDGKKRKDLFIPTYEEYLKVCAKYDKIAVVELKSDFTKAEVQEIIELTRTHGNIEKTTFISFILQNLVFVRELLPLQPAQYLVGCWEQSIADVLKQYNLDLDIEHGALSKELIDRLHADGIKINCWTVDDAEKAKTLLSWGVDFITSNALE